MLELYLGGARSGKSQLAEQRAISTGLELVYLATATAGDKEMAARIAHHRRQRLNLGWETIEEPLNITKVLQECSASGRCILLDCLTLWLSNHLYMDTSKPWGQVRSELLALLPQLPGHIILVSNEVGQGIVPLGELNRRFVDESGRLHQDIAALADRVVFVTAGLEQVLKA